jgi:aspartate 1-decarboxylase
MRKILLLLPFFLWTCGGGSTEPEPPQLPTVSNIEVTTLEDTAKTFALTGTDPNNLVLTYSISTQPQHGTISISGGAATYTPNANYHGQDVIAYLASTTSGNSNVGTIIITITPVDDEPNTMDVTATTDEDNSVTMTLEAEEYDGENIEFQVRNNPSNGSVTISGTTATYIPNQDWYGTDQFNFEAVDSSSRSELNVATATITVNPINDSPQANDINDVEVLINESIDISLSGTDVDNDNLTYTIVEQPSKGSVTISGSVATFSSSLGGNDVFTYKVNDGQEDSDVATVNIEVTFNNIFIDSGNHDQLFGMKQISDNNVILMGQFNKTGPWTMSSFIAKVSPEAEILWSSEINLGVNREYIADVVETDNGNLIFVGHNDSRLGILITDSSGNIISNERFENKGPGKEIFRISNNEFLIHTTNTGDDIVLMKIDESGNELASSSSDIGYPHIGEQWNNTSIQLSSSEFLLLHKEDNNEFHLKQVNTSFDVSLYDIYSNSEEYQGSIDILISSNNDIFIAANLDNQGIDVIKEGDFRITDNDIRYNQGAYATNDGGILVSGIYGNPRTATLFNKYDSSGNLEWNSFIELNDFLNKVGIIELSDGTFLVATSMDYDIFIFKLDSNGNRIK